MRSTLLQHTCPARGKKYTKCEKIGHYVECCRTNKRVNRIQKHETSSAEEDDWSPNTIHSVNQKTLSTRQMNKDVPEFLTLMALVNNRPIKFKLDRGSPVTLIGKFVISMDTGMTDPQVNHIMEDPDITTLERKFEKRFNGNHTVNGLKEMIQSKEDAILKQQN